jgi:hypothetical protein
MIFGGIFSLLAKSECGRNLLLKVIFIYIFNDIIKYTFINYTNIM